jgi:cell division protease FtsH
MQPKKTDKDDEKKQQELRQKQINGLIGYFVFSPIAAWLFQQFILTPLAIRTTQIPYSEFRAKIESEEIVSVTVGNERIVGTMKNPDPSSSTKEIGFKTVAVPGGDPTLIEKLDASKVSYTMAEPASPLGGILLSYLLPMALIGGIWYLGYRQMAKSGMKAGGMMGGIFGVGKSKATEVKPETIGVTYKDVGGADEAIAELREIIQFLKTPEQFARLGGRIPMGILLVGPPGTG